MKKENIFCSSPKLIFRRDINRFFYRSSKISLFYDCDEVCTFDSRLMRPEQICSKLRYRLLDYCNNELQVSDFDNTFFNVISDLSLLDLDTDDVVVKVDDCFTFSPLMWVRCGHCNCCASVASSSLTARTDLILKHTNYTSFLVTFTVADYSNFSYSLVRDFIGNVMRRLQSKGQRFIQYFIRGEYGNIKSCRPHYHVVLHDFVPSVNAVDYASQLAFRNAVIDELHIELNHLYHYTEISYNDYQHYIDLYGVDNVDMQQIYNVHFKAYENHYYLLHGHIDIDVMEVDPTVDTSKSLSSYLSSYVSMSDSVNRFVKYPEMLPIQIDSLYRQHPEMFPDKCKDIYKYYRTYIVYDTKREVFCLAPFTRFSQLYGLSYLSVPRDCSSEFFHEHSELLCFKPRFICTPHDFMPDEFMHCVRYMLSYDVVHTCADSSILRQLYICLCNVGVFVDLSQSACQKFLNQSYIDDRRSSYDECLNYCNVYSESLGFDTIFDYINSFSEAFDMYVSDSDYLASFPSNKINRELSIARCNQFALENFKKRKL